jgi:dTDP-4-amino-4,6-dideoxygalactose transaminase
VIPFGKPVFDDEMRDAAVRALQEENFVLGDSVFRFEEEFARYVGTRYAVSTSSGTSALHIALLAAGLGPGAEVITTASSFIATANAILHAGAVPRFADIGNDYNIEPDLARRLLSPRTRAILPVHLYGLPAPMDEINDLARRHGLLVLEDACQAHGATYRGRRAGSLGAAACFSFYTTKNMMVGGDGGMITTDDEQLARRAACLRNSGRLSQYEHGEVGFTARLNTVNAAIGRVQLRRLEEWNGRRRRHAEAYRQGLAALPGVRLPPEPDHARGNYHLYAVRAERRDELLSFLAARGVQCGTNYPIPIPYQPVYRRLFGFRGTEFPRSQELSSSVLCLPIYPELRADEIARICDVVRAFYGGNS